MSKDVYGSIAQLSALEREGFDYRVRRRIVPGSSTAIVAPHGGRIERRTSRIARAIAGKDFNLYLFEGTKSSGNRTLHITSHRFDELRCLSMVSKAERVIAIHGCRGRDHIVYLGGLDKATKSALASGLRAGGFRVKTTFHKFLATHPQNICNRGAKGNGVQIELSLGLRLTGNIDSLAFTIGRVLRERKV